MRVLGYGTLLVIESVLMKIKEGTMTTFSLSGIIQLGPLKGKSVKEAIESDPTAFISFLNKHDSLQPDEAAQAFMLENGIFWHLDNAERRAEPIDLDCEADEMDNGYDYMDYYSETYEQYNGSYAQDEMGWSDQMIGDVLDGDPDLYWNID